MGAVTFNFTVPTSQWMQTSFIAISMQQMTEPTVCNCSTHDSMDTTEDVVGDLPLRVYMHMYCPDAYCKLQETDFNLTSPDVQCAFGPSGARPANSHAFTVSLTISV